MRVLEDQLREVLENEDSDSEVWGGTPGNLKSNPSSGDDDDDTGGLQIKL